VTREWPRVGLGAENPAYGVAMISRLLKIIGLFCKRALVKSLYSAQETWTFMEPTHLSHPIADLHSW